MPEWSLVATDGLPGDETSRLCIPGRGWIYRNTIRAWNTVALVFVPDGNAEEDEASGPSPTIHSGVGVSKGTSTAQADGVTVEDAVAALRSARRVDEGQD